MELSSPYGSLPNFDSEPLFMLNGPEKEAIAKCAAGLLESGDSVFLNSSSTAQRIFQYLDGKPLTIITNNGRSLNIRRGPGTELVLIGGQVGNSDPNGTLMKTSMTGDFAVDMISKISATKCVLGVSGISVRGGLTSLAIQDPAVDKGIKEALNSGVLAGYPVEDIKVELIDGSFHEVDSSEAAFKVAGSMAIKDALKKSDPVILEPVMAVEVETPEEYTGFVMGDIPSRRGIIQGQEQRGNAVAISAKVPLSQMFGYATDLRSGTQGRATYTMQFDSYEPVPKSVATEIVSKAGGNA